MKVIDRKGYSLTPLLEPKIDLQKEFAPLIAKYFKEERKKEIEAVRLRFSDSLPEIGERCIIWQGKDKPVYFGVRSSQNYYRSGSWTMPVDTEGLMVVTLREVLGSEI